MVARIPIFDGWQKAIKAGDESRAIPGPRLAFEESEILIGSILTLMKEHQVPALPIHDALIVPRSARDVATTVMKSVFEGRVGLVPFVKATHGHPRRPEPAYAIPGVTVRIWVNWVEPRVEVPGQCPTAGSRETYRLPAAPNSAPRCIAWPTRLE